MFLATIKLFSFLINPEFWARTGFFVGYIIAFLLVLEVVRLASTDANRKEVEKLLDAYAASRSDVPVRRRREETAPVKKVVQVSIDELEDMERRSVIAEQERQTQEHQERERTRTPSPAAARTPESKHTEEKRRRRTTSTSVAPHATSQSHSHPQTNSSSSPTRRLRKRSDTLNSSSSAEAKGTAVRRRREASPIESKTRESRHASPTPRSRSKEAKILGGSLGKMLRSRG